MSRSILGRARAAAVVMLVASLGPLALLLSGVIESQSNPWAVMTIWFAAGGVLVLSVPLIAIAIGIFRGSPVARWSGIVVGVLGGLLGAAAAIANAWGVSGGIGLSFVSIWLVIVTGLCAFIVWALATASDYFRRTRVPGPRNR